MPPERRGMDEKVCPQCGKKYTAKWIDQTYCSTECYHESRRKKPKKAKNEEPEDKRTQLYEVNAMAKRVGLSYGTFMAELTAHKMTLEEYVKNGESFYKPKKERKRVVAPSSEGMPEEVFDAITESIVAYKEYISDLKREKEPKGMQKEALERMRRENKIEVKRMEKKIRILAKYQKEHYVIGG